MYKKVFFLVLCAIVGSYSQVCFGMSSALVGLTAGVEAACNYSNYSDDKSGIVNVVAPVMVSAFVRDTCGLKGPQAAVANYLVFLGVCYKNRKSFISIQDLKDLKADEATLKKYAKPLTFFLGAFLAGTFSDCMFSGFNKSRVESTPRKANSSPIGFDPLVSARQEIERLRPKADECDQVKALNSWLTTQLNFFKAGLNLVVTKTSESIQKYQESRDTFIAARDAKYRDLETTAFLITQQERLADARRYREIVEGRNAMERMYHSFIEYFNKHLPQ